VLPAHAPGGIEVLAAQLQLITDTVPIAIVYVDRETRYTFSNLHYETKYGRKRAEILGKTMREVLGADRYPLFEPHVQKALAGEATSFEAEIPRPEQGPMIALISYVPDVDEGGAVRGFVSIAQDITEQKRSHEALASTLEKLHLTLSSAQMGAWDWDIKSGKIIWDDRTQELFGFTPGTFPGTHDAYFERLHPDDREPTRRRYHECLAALRDFDIEYRAVWPDGSIQWMNSIGRVHYGPDGEPARMVGVVLDIQKRKQEEEALRALHEITSELSRARTEAEVLDVVRSKVFTAFHATSGMLYEPAPDAESLRLLAYAGFSEEVLARWRQLPLDGSLPVSDALVRGEPVFIETADELRQGYPIARGSSSGIQALASLPMIVQNRKLGVLTFIYLKPQALSQNTRRLMQTFAAHCAEALERSRLFDMSEHAVKARDALISVSSHELLTPVAGSKLQMQLMRRRMDQGIEITPEMVRKMVDQTERQLDRLHRLVNEMLDLSRINLGKLTLHPSETNLSALTSDLVERMSGQLQSAGCPVFVDIDQGVHGQLDSYRIEQVLSNLVSNACRYARGKPVSIRLKREAGEMARLEVEDQGAGIKKEDQERIFQRFERAASMDEGSGLGLGLFVARQIVEAHEGRVELESEPGKGAKFVVRIPLSRKGP
jgi:PAS domain S-box-containing protein